jgi:hypothetical protein
MVQGWTLRFQPPIEEILESLKSLPDLLLRRRNIYNIRYPAKTRIGIIQLACFQEWSARIPSTRLQMIAVGAGVKRRPGKIPAVLPPRIA